MRRTFKEMEVVTICHENFESFKKRYGKDVSMQNGYSISVNLLIEWLAKLKEVSTKDFMKECNVSYEVANDVMNILFKRRVLKLRES